jgi:O-methyltransferase
MSRADKETVSSTYSTLRSESPWSHESSPYLHHRVLPYATLAPWLTDELFLKTYEAIKDHTLVDIYRCYELWSLAKESAKVDGVILEVGVWRGGTGALISEATRNSNKKIYLADTFCGVVKAGSNDTSYKGGEHADTSTKDVLDLLDSLSLENFTILEGVFPEDTSHSISEKIALLHCDVDVYSSAKDIVDWCLPRMSIGSAMIFDDYGFYGCEGVTKICDELRKEKDLLFVHNLNGHAILIKIR